MTRTIRVAAAQMGPVGMEETRGDVVVRLCAAMERAAACGSDLVVFPELALTPFFPHWEIPDTAEFHAFFEKSMPSPDVQPLFDAAKQLRIGFYLGYAELDDEVGKKHYFNTSILVDKEANVVGKYRKIHLPGYEESDPAFTFQNLEKKYFQVGDLGFGVWDAFGARIGMCICNDRRWPETYRVMALQGAELILLGYNTPMHHPAMPQIDHLVNFHNHLSMQAGAYQNSCWVIGVAKAGVEAGVSQIGQSCIIAPSGEIVTQCATLGDEVIWFDCDLDLGRAYRDDLLNLARHRRPENYQIIAEKL